MIAAIRNDNVRRKEIRGLFFMLTFLKTLWFVKNLLKHDIIPISQIFSNQDAQAIDLLEKMLAFDSMKCVIAERYPILI